MMTLFVLVVARQLDWSDPYMAMARARSSESVQVRDIQAMLRGCEKVAKVWVQTIPKYLAPLRLSPNSVKPRLKMLPRRWQLRPTMTVSGRRLLRGCQRCWRQYGIMVLVTHKWSEM
jgi:hypothetical protein